MNYMDDASTFERSLLQKARQKHIPVTGALELLPLCNMNCDMCYVRLSRSEMERQGRLRTVEEWVRLAEQMQKAGTVFLLLTGGEPLLFPDFKTLYRRLRNLGMILTINTNGTLLDEAWADFFATYPPRRINITLYGADAASYDRLCHFPQGFDQTLRPVRRMEARDNAERVHLLQLSCDTELVVITDHAACLNLKKIADRLISDRNLDLVIIKTVPDQTDLHLCTGGTADEINRIYIIFQGTEPDLHRVARVRLKRNLILRGFIAVERMLVEHRPHL